MCDIKISKTQIKKYQHDLFKDVPYCIPTCIIMVGGPCSGKTTAQKITVK